MEFRSTKGTQKYFTKEKAKKSFQISMILDQVILIIKKEKNMMGMRMRKLMLISMPQSSLKMISSLFFQMDQD